MNILKSAVISICFCSVAVGIIEMLLPDNSYRNRIRLLTGAVLMISMLTPFFSLSKLEMPEFSDSIVDFEVNESLEKAAAMSVSSAVDDILQKHGVQNAKISIFTDRNADNSININKAVIAVEKSMIANASAAAKEASDKLETRVEVEELSGE